MKHLIKTVEDLQGALFGADMDSFTSVFAIEHFQLAHRHVCQSVAFLMLCHRQATCDDIPSKLALDLGGPNDDLDVEKIIKAIDVVFNMLVAQQPPAIVVPHWLLALDTLRCAEHHLNLCQLHNTRAIAERQQLAARLSAR